MSSIDASKLKTLFEYSNGFLYWKISKHGVKRGVPIKGGSRKYKQVMVDGKGYLQHRIIFALHHGYFPVIVDHINGDTYDNRIENLRDVDRAGNMQNVRNCYSSSSSKLLGAFTKKKTGRFYSVISVNNKRIWLGSFYRAEDAHQAYLKAKRKYHDTCSI